MPTARGCRRSTCHSSAPASRSRSEGVDRGQRPRPGSYPSVDVVDDGSLSAEQLQQLRWSALQPLTAVTQTYTIRATRSSTPTCPAPTGSIRGRADRVAALRPDRRTHDAVPARVGRSGRSGGSSPNVRLNGIDVRQTHEVTLQVTGNVVVFDLELTQVAPRQTADVPGARGCRGRGRDVAAHRQREHDRRPHRPHAARPGATSRAPSGCGSVGRAPTSARNDVDTDVTLADQSNGWSSRSSASFWRTRSASPAWNATMRSWRSGSADARMRTASNPALRARRRRRSRQGFHWASARSTAASRARRGAATGRGRRSPGAA